MKRITLALLFCVVFTPNFLRAQTDGIAELNVYGSISVVEGFVADPPTETWVLAEFNDTLGIVGYLDALIDSSTGEILSVNELDFTYTDPNSLSMNLYTPGSPEPFATIIVIEDDGVIHELTDQNPNPPNEPNLGPLTTNEKWLRDKVLGVTSQDNPKIFRTQQGKNLGDFVVVRFGKAVIIEVKTPTSNPPDDATVSDGSPQIDRNKDGHVKTETGATSVTGGITVTLPTNPDNDDWQIIWNRLKELTPANN